MTHINPDTRILLQFARRWKSELAKDADIESLEGGLLNNVWRVSDGKHSCILKHYPPHIASQPDIPLDTHRATIEARALHELSAGELQGVQTSRVSVPRYLGFDSDRKILGMEEVNYSDTLEDQLVGKQSAEKALEAVGEFIGRLHRYTVEKSRFKEKFDNRPMQETRLQVQYEPVPEQLEQYGINHAEQLGRKSVRLGKQLLKPGRCLIMGDLWPQSILMTDDQYKIIDWELSHYGRPLQDIGHMAAHIWMNRTSIGEDPTPLIRTFFEWYQETLGDKFSIPWDEQEKKGAAIHMGSEIITRVLGAFSEGYLDGIFQEENLRNRALQQAQFLLNAPGKAFRKVFSG